MKCGRFHFTFFSVLLLAVFFATFLSTDSYAVSDLTVSYQAGDTIPASTIYFPDCNESCYSQYSYIIFDFSNPSSNFTYSSTFSIRGLSKYNGSTRQLNFYSEYSSLILSLNSTKSLYGFYSNPNNSTTLLTDLTITLTESLSPNAPSGSITLTENGTYDVSSYSEAIVDVPPEVVEGDYHDDLVDLKMVILIVPAVMIMLYVFFSIYKLLFRRS